MGILYIRDGSGNFVPIPALKGEAGKSAYEQAKEGGYKGTEEEFVAILNGLTSSEDASHYADLNNPHNVTKVQVGLGNVDNTSDIDKPMSEATAEYIKGHGLGVRAPKLMETKPSEIYDLGCGFYRYKLNEQVILQLSSASESEGDNANRGVQMRVYNGLEMPTVSVRGYNSHLGEEESFTWYDLMHSGNLATLLNNVIKTDSYVGLNEYNADNPNELEFDFEPHLVCVVADSDTEKGAMIMINGCSFSPVMMNLSDNIHHFNNVTWDGKKVSWYSTESSYYQLNQADTTYRIFAI